MNRLEIHFCEVETAISVMREVAAWGRKQGYRVWPDEWLTKEELITPDAQPENFCVGMIDGEIACAFILQWADSNYWPNAPKYEAAYLHKFCVRRRFAGMGMTKLVTEAICAECRKRGVVAEGKLEFGPLSPLKYDIMGPFAFVPFMECRHSVWSMRHSVRGTILFNGREYSFDKGWGYWEGDRGRSFPKEYAWTQCCFYGGSLMLSVADIPLGGFRFTGVIAAVLWQGKEYRLATYLGARAVNIRNGRIRIVQGDMELEACLLEAAERPLKAPIMGDMTRTIHESAVCWASYQFRKAGQTLFSFETELASFEYEYPS